jgi:hypothetical protein
LLFGQALFDELALELRQARLQEVAIALNVASMRSQASQLSINHLSLSFDELIPFPRHSKECLRSELLQKNSELLQKKSLGRYRPEIAGLGSITLL